MNVNNDLILQFGNYIIFEIIGYLVCQKFTVNDPDSRRRSISNIPSPNRQ